MDNYRDYATPGQPNQTYVPPASPDYVAPESYPPSAIHPTPVSESQEWVGPSTSEWVSPGAADKPRADADLQADAKHLGGNLGARIDVHPTRKGTFTLTIVGEDSTSTITGSRSELHAFVHRLQRLVYESA